MTTAGRKTWRPGGRSADRFRSHGLDRDSERIVDLIEGYGLKGVSVLEVGGGVGQLHRELLRRGASRATSIELTGSDRRPGADTVEALLIVNRSPTARRDRARRPLTPSGRLGRRC